MKRFISLFIALVAVAILALTAAAEPASITVYVSMSDAGTSVLACMPVTVSDADGDGKLTVNDALICTHEKHYKDGKDGYKVENGYYGPMVATLWGTTNGGSYGFYLNNVMGLSLAEELKNGDSLYAYSYADLTAWSDMYSFFTATEKDGKLTLTLSANGYDAEWNPTVIKVSGAVIYVDGKATEYVTDENGSVEIEITENGRHIITAKAEGVNIVTPTYAYTVGSTGDNGAVWLVLTALVALAAAAVLAKRIKNEAK